jgi:hypothetical protein
MNQTQARRRIQAHARKLARYIDATGEIKDMAPSWVWDIAKQYDGTRGGSFTEGRTVLPRIRAIALDIVAGGNATDFANADYEAGEFCNLDGLTQWLWDVKAAREFCEMHNGTLSECLRLGHRDWLADLYRNTVADLIVRGE